MRVIAPTTSHPALRASTTASSNESPVVDYVVDDNHLGFCRWRVLNAPLRAVLLGFLANVESLKRSTSLMRPDDHRADNGVGPERQSAHGRRLFGQSIKGVEKRIPDQARTVRTQRHWLAIEVEVRFLAGAEGDWPYPCCPSIEERTKVIPDPGGHAGASKESQSFYSIRRTKSLRRFRSPLLFQPVDSRLGLLNILFACRDPLAEGNRDDLPSALTVVRYKFIQLCPVVSRQADASLLPCHRES